jgi:biopolymer transport protein ExbB/TolQ
MDDFEQLSEPSPDEPAATKSANWKPLAIAGVALTVVAMVGLILWRLAASLSLEEEALAVAQAHLRRQLHHPDSLQIVHAPGPKLLAAESMKNNQPAAIVRILYRFRNQQGEMEQAERVFMIQEGQVVSAGPVEQFMHLLE